MLPKAKPEQVRLQMPTLLKRTDFNQSCVGFILILIFKLRFLNCLYTKLYNKYCYKCVSLATAKIFMHITFFPFVRLFPKDKVLYIF